MYKKDDQIATISLGIGKTVNQHNFIFFLTYFSFQTMDKHIAYLLHHLSYFMNLRINHSGPSETASLDSHWSDQYIS